MADEDTKKPEFEKPEFEEIELVAAQPREPLPANDLRWVCEPSGFPFDSTAEAEPLAGVIGQDAAMDALRFGLAVHAPGQNIFVRGLKGTGRMTLVRRLLEEIRPDCPNAQDRCYVHNFSHPDRPRLITLTRGSAWDFKRHIDELVDFVRDELEGALSSESLKARREAREKEAQAKMDELVEPFEKSVKEAGLALVSIKVGPAFQAVIFPAKDGQPVPPEEWQKLRADGKITDEAAAEIEKGVASFQNQLGEVMEKVNELRRRFQQEQHALREEAARGVLAPFMQAIRRNFTSESVTIFLDELTAEISTSYIRRKPEDEDEDEELRRFRVNVLMSHDTQDVCPIVMENTPTVRNLLGTIDHRTERGTVGLSDHLLVRAGSILRADGGYLILEARDVVREPGAWRMLLRTLRTGHMEIVPPELSGPWWGSSIKPEAIDVNLKVILIGDADMYHVLDAYDPDFPNLFKVLADFDSEIPRSEESIAKYGGVLSRIATEEDLLHFDRTAVAALCEHGSRISGRQQKLTTRFGRLADLAREASFLARQEQKEIVTGDDVRRAIRNSRQRASLPSKRFQEYLSNGTIRVQTDGSKVGQVNGLAVTQAGPLTFGFPARITATIGPGSAGVINIEREANMSGAVHTKGFYILGGLLRFLLRTDHPLAFEASIAFEQSYGGIDGDSASGAEICCLLSALTEIPIRQEIAMTGAIDQVGNILAIGAANEKVEGFYDTCANSGLTGSQGVIIPRANQGDLMLRHDVVEACREGRFDVHAVDNVYDALELLTGIEAGRRDENGLFPIGSILGIAVIKAYEYWLKAVKGSDWYYSGEGEETEEPTPNTGPPVAADDH